MFKNTFKSRNRLCKWRFSRETESCVCVCVCVCVCRERETECEREMAGETERNYKKLVHMIIEANKSQDL